MRNPALKLENILEKNPELFYFKGHDVFQEAIGTVKMRNGCIERSTGKNVKMDNLQNLHGRKLLP